MSKKTKKETQSAETSVPSPQVQELTTEQEINALKQAHKFFAEYTGVPGFLATNWGQALDTIAIVANSLISKSGLLEKKPSAPAQQNGADSAPPAA